MEIFRSVQVYIRNVYAGELSETDEGYLFPMMKNTEKRRCQCGISYNADPTGTIPVENIVFFFDGLIPEGWLLGVVSRNWKIDVKDRFGLLAVACRDAIGNVSIREKKE